MRKLILTLILATGFGVCLYSQEDPRLKERLDSLLVATQTFDYDRILDLTYPKLFKVVDRDQMKSVLRQSFENNLFTIALDSIFFLKMSAVIKVDESEYVKVKHNMVLIFTFSDTSKTEENLGMQEVMAGSLEGKYGEGNVHYDKQKQKVIIRTQPIMIGVKESESGEWTFVNAGDESNEMMMNFLFSEAVRQKLGTLKI